REGNKPVVPLLGPIAENDGLTFRYFNADDIDITPPPNTVMDATTRQSIRRIEIAVRARRQGGGADTAVDSLVTQVALRGNGVYGLAHPRCRGGSDDREESMIAFKERGEGFALSTAIVALVVIGLLVTGGFFAASQEGRNSTSSADADLALRVAEHGINTAVGTWTVGGLSNVGKDGPKSIGLTVGGRTVGTAAVEARR